MTGEWRGWGLVCIDCVLAWGGVLMSTQATPPTIRPQGQTYQHYNRNWIPIPVYYYGKRNHLAGDDWP